MSRSAGEREATASAATCTSTPRPSRSRTVWLTQTCASIPQTSAWSRPSRSKPSARAAENSVFGEPRHALEVLDDLGDRRAEPARVLLGDDQRQAEHARALREHRRALRDLLEALDRRPERLLHVDDDERGPLAVERRGAHAAELPSSGAALTANERSR